MLPNSIAQILYLKLFLSVAQPEFDLGEGTAVMDPEIWNRGGSCSPPLSPLPLE